MAKKKDKDVQKINLHEAEDLWGSIAAEDSYESDDDLFLDDLLDGSDYTADSSGYQEEFQSYEDLYEEKDVSHDDEYAEEYYDEEQPLEEYEDPYTEEAELYEEAPSEEQVYEEVIPPAEQEFEEVLEAEAPAEASAPKVITAILEHIGGMKQEVTNAKLFEPEENSLLAVDEESGEEQVFFFEQLTCLWLSSLPTILAGRKKESCIKEIVESDDGQKHYVFVHPQQNLKSVLFAYSIDDESDFPVTLIPTSHIKKRTQDRQVAEILLEKRYISKNILRRAQKEYVQLKSMTFEKIIAKRAQMPLEDVEKIIKDGMEGPFMGMQKEEILLFSGIMTEADVLGSAEDLEKIEKLKFAQYLIDRKIVGEKEVYECLAEKHRVPFLNLKERKINKKSFSLLPKYLIKKHEILPLGKSEDTLLVAAHYVDMEHLAEPIANAAGCKNVKFVVSPAGQIRKVISLFCN